MLQKLTEKATQRVTSLPGTTQWLASSDGGLLRGGRPGEEIVTLAQPSRNAAAQPIGLLGIDADLALVAFDRKTGVVRLQAEGAKVVPLSELPGSAGVLSAFKGGMPAYLASGNRLSLVSPRAFTVTADDRFAEHFTAVAVGADVICVGRGDGAVELRDPTTLALEERFDSGAGEAVLALHFVTSELIAVATDDRKMRFLDLGQRTWSVVERFVELVMTSGGLVQRGGGKLIDFVPLSDGRFAAIGLSRSVSLFEGAREIAAGTFDDVLGEAQVLSASALRTEEEELLLLACGEAGLYSVDVSLLERLGLDSPHPARLHFALQQLPMAPDEPTRARVAELSQHPEAQIRATALAARIRWGDDLSGELQADLRAGDPTRQMNALRTAGNGKVFLGEAIRECLSSSEEWLRFYAADHYLYTSVGVHERALELQPVLKDDSERVVAAAVASLGAIGNPVAIDWIRPLLREPRLNIAFTAVVSLLELEGKAAATPIADAIREGQGALSITLLELSADVPALYRERVTEPLPSDPTVDTLRSWLEAQASLLASEDPLTRLQRLRSTPAKPLWHALLPVLNPLRICLSVEQGALRLVPVEDGAALWAARIREGVVRRR